MGKSLYTNIMLFIGTVSLIISAVLAIFKFGDPVIFAIIGAYGIANVIVDIITDKVYPKSSKMYKLQEEERNQAISGKANGIAYEFAKACLIIGAIYMWVYKKDLFGLIMFIIMYICCNAVFAYSYKKYNAIS